MNTSEFLAKAVLAANEGGHPFPEYAACEAALESAWGESKLAKEFNNLFGQKFPKSVHFNFPYSFASIPTHEHDKADHDTGLEPALWVVFPDWATAFRERMNLLHRLSTVTLHTGQLEFPHYAAALLATDGPSFVTEVSKDWATDQQRAKNVLRTYASHFKNDAPMLPDGAYVPTASLTWTNPTGVGIPEVPNATTSRS